MADNYEMFHLTELLPIAVGGILFPIANGSVSPEGRMLDWEFPMLAVQGVLNYMTGEEIITPPDIIRAYEAARPLIQKQVPCLADIQLRPKGSSETLEDYAKYLGDLAQDLGSKNGFWHQLTPMSVWRPGPDADHIVNVPVDKPPFPGRLEP